MSVMVSIPFGTATIKATRSWLTVRFANGNVSRLKGHQELASLAALVDRVSAETFSSCQFGSRELSVSCCETHGVSLCFGQNATGYAGPEAVGDLASWLAASTGACAEPHPFDNNGALSLSTIGGQLHVSGGSERLRLTAKAGEKLLRLVTSGVAGTLAVNENHWCNHDEEGRNLHGNVGVYRDAEEYLLAVTLRSGGTSSHYDYGRSSLAFFAEELTAALATIGGQVARSGVSPS